MRGFAGSVCLFLLLFAARFPVPAQESLPGDPLSFLGLHLTELVSRFGPPEAVYALRGNEVWQDDVVFVYTGGDFYIAKDRVWQIAPKSLYGLKPGDSKAAALLALGNEVQDRGSHALVFFPGGPWPRIARVNFNGEGRVSALFVYRADY